MSSNPVTPAQQAARNVKNAQAAGKSVYDAVNEVLQDPLKASQAASDAISEGIAHSTTLKITVDAMMVLLNPLLTAMFAALSEVRHSTTNNLGATMAEILNEFLGTSLTSADVAPIGGGAGDTGDPSAATMARATALGNAVLNQLEKEFTQPPLPGQGKGERAAKTFAGYGVNFGVQNGILALILSLLPETRADEIREMGVEVAQNLGLGRLMRVALRPLVQTLIATPYQRELQAKYRTNLPAVAELAKAWHASRLDQSTVLTYLQEQGLTDSMIGEVLEQTRHRLTAKEWDLLTAQGKQPDDDQALIENAEGMDSDWVAARLSLTTWDRLRPLRDRVLSELLPMVKERYLTVPQFTGALDRYQIPKDEQDLWRAAAAGFLEVARRRLNLAEMLFLYEASQLTDDDVQQWLEVEGYSAQDVQRMLTYFRLKFIAATEGKSANQAARAANLHAEHTAFVTDEITGIWGRPPTPAELNYWVTLLDGARRTKHDFTTELKALPTDGPAMP